MPSKLRVEPIIRLLTALLVFMIFAIFASDLWFKDDSQLFQVISNMATGVMGALLGIITGRNSVDPKLIVGSDTKPDDKKDV